MKKTDARCSGMMLTVGFHNANPPLIWRFDLERNHSFTLALQGEDGDWELGVTAPKGDFYPVVRFSAREDAEEAFAKIARVLAQRRHSPAGLVGKALMIVAGAAVLISLVIYVFASNTTNANSPADLRAGIPMTADDVLKAPTP